MLVDDMEMKMEEKLVDLTTLEMKTKQKNRKVRIKEMEKTGVS